MASRGINKAIIVGNLGNDPEMRYLPSGVAVTSISVATSESWNDKQTGQPQERTEWHRIEAFGKLAEIMGQYLRKGSQVYIEGSIRTDKWQDTNGQDKYSTKIRAENLQMLGGKQGGSADFGQQAPQQQAPQQMGQQNAGQPMGQQQHQGQAMPQQGGGQFAPQPQQQQQPAPNQFENKFQAPKIDNDDDFGDDIPF